MTGKDLKQIVSRIPDDAVVDLGINENKECTYYRPDSIVGAVVQTKVKFNSGLFSGNTTETTVIFDVTE